MPTFNRIINSNKILINLFTYILFNKLFRYNIALVIYYTGREEFLHSATVLEARGHPGRSYRIIPQYE